MREMLSFHPGDYWAVGWAAMLLDLNRRSFPGVVATGVLASLVGQPIYAGSGFDGRVTYLCWLCAFSICLGARRARRNRVIDGGCMPDDLLS